MQFTGRPGPLPRDVLITFPLWSPWVTKLETSKGGLQLTLLCSAWENQWCSASSLALVQRCGIFQENYKIITERGRHLKTDLDKEREKKRQARFPRVPRTQGLGMSKPKLPVFISHPKSPGQHRNLTGAPGHPCLLGFEVQGPTGPVASAERGS